jgi:hypothetical protein
MQLCGACAGVDCAAHATAKSGGPSLSCETLLAVVRLSIHMPNGWILRASWLHPCAGQDALRRCRGSIVCYLACKERLLLLRAKAGDLRADSQ